MCHESFAVLILSNGRADNVITLETIRRAGYTGQVVIVIDDEDETADEYRERFDRPDEGLRVVEFCKREEIAKTDVRNNFHDPRAAVFARNKTWDIAAELGLDHFIILDDDYTDFHSRVGPDDTYLSSCAVRDLDAMLDAMIGFLEESGATVVAFSQGGDFLAGEDSPYLRRLSRKCMNSFVCRTDRPLRFSGQMNEDVSAPVEEGARGMLLFTIGQVHLNQVQTQAGAGGMSEVYADNGTYVKAFYSVMGAPSCVKVAMMGSTNPRLHHAVDWQNAVPMLVSEDQRR